jgi:hypothetical protein
MIKKFKTETIKLKNRKITKYYKIKVQLMRCQIK